MIFRKYYYKNQIHVQINDVFHYLKVMINEQYKYSELTGKVIACAMKVHSTLGNGFQEVIYQRALEIEFSLADIPFSREFEMPIFYRYQQIGTRRVDFLVAEVLSVEIKATTKLEVGLLINFGERSLNFKRLQNKKFIEKQ